MSQISKKMPSSTNSECSQPVFNFNFEDHSSPQPLSMTSFRTGERTLIVTQVPIMSQQSSNVHKVSKLYQFIQKKSSSSPEKQPLCSPPPIDKEEVKNSIKNKLEKRKKYQPSHQELPLKTRPRVAVPRKTIMETNDFKWLCPGVECHKSYASKQMLRWHIKNKHDPFDQQVLLQKIEPPINRIQWKKK